MKKHGRIIFNGNNYAEEWVAEAAKRGLPNVRNTVDALKAFTTPKALALFSKYKVLSHEEMHSRYEIYLEQYAKHINIEARTASQMVRRQFLPAAMLYMTELGNSVKAAGAAAKVQKSYLAEIGALVVSADKNVKLVEKEAEKAHAAGSAERVAAAFRDKVVPALRALRADVDALESLCPADLWPVPTYADLLFKL